MILKLPERKINSHKNSYGKILNIAGSDYYRGAAYLSSVSALKVGCGYVALASDEKVIDSVSSQTSDIVFVGLKDIDEHINDFSVISIGCGLSTSDAAKNLLKKIIRSVKDTEKTLVIDADGLNLLAKNSTISLPQRTILTPHPKEAARLLNVDLHEIAYNPKNSAKRIFEKFGTTTVLKMHNTIVYSKKGEIFVNDTGNSALSKAGSGDVLCGMLSGILAQGLEDYEASCLAVKMHGIVGELAAKDLTEYSVLASDLIKYIPLAIRQFS